MVQERWRSVGEIADYLRVSKDIVYAWVNQKRMPGHKVGRLRKFTSAQMDDWARTGGAAPEGTGFAEGEKE